MRIYFLTTDDRVFLPHFFEQVFGETDAEIIGLALVNDPSLKTFLLKSFSFLGPFTFAREVWYQARLRLMASLAPSRPPTIGSVCAKYGVTVTSVKKVNDKSFRSFLRESDIDVLVSVACPQILRKKILEIPKLAAINVHYALLPEYRGQYPSFWVLAEGEEYTGVSVHYMAELVDAGDVLVQVKDKILAEDTFYTLVRRLKTTIGPSALIEALRKIRGGDEFVLKNEAEKGTYYGFPTRADMQRFRKRGRRWR